MFGERSYFLTKGIESEKDFKSEACFQPCESTHNVQQGWWPMWVRIFTDLFFCMHILEYACTVFDNYHTCPVPLSYTVPSKLFHASKSPVKRLSHHNQQGFLHPTGSNWQSCPQIYKGLGLGGIKARHSSGFNRGLGSGFFNSLCIIHCGGIVCEARSLRISCSICTPEDALSKAVQNIYKGIQYLLHTTKREITNYMYEWDI